MKKNSIVMRAMMILMALCMTLALALSLAGCGKKAEEKPADQPKEEQKEESVFGVETNDDNTVSVKATNASEDSAGTASIKVEEGEEIIIEPAIDGDGQISFVFYKPDNHDEEEIDYTAEGNEPGFIGLAAGEYDIVVTALTEVTGTVQVSTGLPFSEDDGWTDAKNAEEAAKAAGLDMFSYDEGDEISLGLINAEKIQYQNGIVRAKVPVGAVDMKIYKGLKSVAGEDVSFDDDEYKNEWEQSVKGLTVKCFGNRKGEATKTIWTSGDYSYAITAHGAGGDTDFGLSADDLSEIINAMQ